jgi:hypothetical protein
VFVESREKCDLEREATGVVGGLPVGNAVVSSLTSTRVLKDKESSSNLVVMVEVAK